MTSPFICTWDGDAMLPIAACKRLCDKQFVVGQEYRLVENEERSRASHNQYFAALHDAWRNLPERFDGRFASPEHLRKWALIKAGFYVEKTIPVSSHDDALRVAAFISGLDEFAVVVVQDDVVKHYTAKSQSVRSMTKEEFQESKNKVLDEISSLIGVSPDNLQQNAGRAA